MVETIGQSDEGRELVVVWVSSEENLKSLRQNRENLAKIADPRGLTDEQVRRLIATTRPGYHVIGGLHSGETGASEMLMELVYRLAVEASPIISRIRDNVYVSVTPVADADGRDRMVDWFYYGLEAAARPPSGVKRDATSPPGPLSGGKPEAASPPGPPRAGGAGRVEPVAAGTGTGRAGAGQTGRVGAGQAAAAGTGTTETGRAAASPIGSLPYWGKYVFHDNNRDINIALMQMRALTDWYYTAHPPIMHDLHESMALMYTYSGGPPQNPNLDPLLFAELSWFSNWELAQMTKWGMPGVYTHAFMDGWSPGYLGSVAYNHNGVMKMYETQSGRDPAPEATRPAAGEAPLAGAVVSPGKPATPVPATGGTRPAPPAGAARAPATARTAGVQPPPQAGTPQPPPVAAEPQPVPAIGGRGAPAGAAGRGSAVPTGRGGSQDREWYRGIPVPPNAAATFSRRANTNYMQTGVLSSLQLTAMFPDVVLENFYVKTRNSIEDGEVQTAARFRHPGSTRHDEGRRAGSYPAHPGNRGRRRLGDVHDRRTRRTRPGPGSSSSTSRTGGWRRTCSRGRSTRMRD